MSTCTSVLAYLQVRIPKRLEGGMPNGMPNESSSIQKVVREDGFATARLLHGQLKNSQNSSPPRQVTHRGKSLVHSPYVGQLLRVNHFVQCFTTFGHHSFSRKLLPASIQQPPKRETPVLPDRSYAPDNSLVFPSSMLLLLGTGGGNYRLPI